MYVTNKAKTGILDLDIEIDKYLWYIATTAALPVGTYCIAGGSIRCIFDGSRLKDLDIYILGDNQQHHSVMRYLENKYSLDKTVLENPFARVSLITLSAYSLKNFLSEADVNSIYPLEFSIDIQVMSYMYDSKFAARIPKNVDFNERYIDTEASTVKEILNSFDLTLSNAAIEFTIENNLVAVSSVNISQQFLTDVCMRKLVLAKSNSDIPQQLTSLRRFHKFIELGYKIDDGFYKEWDNRLRNNPHILGLSYD